jgi:hypothetical protein
MVFGNRLLRRVFTPKVPRLSGFFIAWKIMNAERHKLLIKEENMHFYGLYSGLIKSVRQV